MEKTGGVSDLAKGSKWLQSSRQRMKKKGTVGSETRLAEKAGMSPLEWAHAHYHDKGNKGEKARFAVNAQK